METRGMAQSFSGFRIQLRFKRFFHCSSHAGTTTGPRLKLFCFVAATELVCVCACACVCHGRHRHGLELKRKSVLCSRSSHDWPRLSRCSVLCYCTSRLAWHMIPRDLGVRTSWNPCWLSSRACNSSRASKLCLLLQPRRFCVFLNVFRACSPISTRVTLREFMSPTSRTHT